MSLLLDVFPRRNIVWVDSLPVNPITQHPDWRNTTHNGKIQAYNEKATKLMHRLGIAVVNPFPLAKLRFFQDFAPDDGIHYEGGDRLVYKSIAWDALNILCQFN